MSVFDPPMSPIKAARDQWVARSLRFRSVQQKIFAASVSQACTGRF